MNKLKLFGVVGLILLLAMPFFEPAFLIDVFLIILSLIGTIVNYFKSKKNDFVMFFSCFLVVVLSEFEVLLINGGGIVQSIFIIAYITLCISSVVFTYRVALTVRRFFKKDMSSS